jgi:hypothetical protein
MNKNAGPHPTAFERAALIGQPFTLANLSMPISGTLTCNCGGPDTALVIVASAPVTCPCCHKTFVVAFNPQNGQLTVAIGHLEEKDPS